MENPFQVKQRNFSFKTTMTAVQNVNFQMFMRFRICEANFQKLGEEKALYLPISEI